MTKSNMKYGEVSRRSRSPREEKSREGRKQESKINEKRSRN
jgi:hypothetical protein